MPPAKHEEIFDSDDDEDLSPEGSYTSVTLGVPDGDVESETELRDPRVSRIGGKPAFVAGLHPDFSSSQCKICSNPMELVVQLWCPIEGSPMDRVMHVWACSRAGCQRKAGSLRAFRGLRYNQKYAEKLEAKKKKDEELKKAEEKKKNEKKINPFSMGAAPSPFGGNNLFGAGFSETADEAPAETADDEDKASDDEDDSIPSDVDEVGDLLSASKIVDSPWDATPGFHPLYLSTVPEYLSSPSSEPKTKSVQDTEDAESGNASWSHEAYENSMNLDDVFERFQRRVEQEPEQCLRYDRGGVPLPFQADQVFDQLFPKPHITATQTSGAAFTVAPAAKREYDASSIPRCPKCSRSRIFECQIMPHVLNVLKAEKVKPKTKLTDEERRQEVMRALKGVQGGAKETEATGMEWGTCLIYACEDDCCVEDDGKWQAQTCWREEHVLVQWDD
ncbi:hypothetical protein SISNIDRAFT_453428 [Sistotremastrum niveocremeum HHB9708]|uniref:Programmed cell death protein 2 C-terminal domain-containing protein n=1 Tax=Sistotremastrum niveocremeum HHB9708 TaxID=1314777 RepID=A0A164VV95_9AGAM|nr:hypothetical protein SISNIDRAFT_453428 [Sistotremastrum niveocremeum HHB9708]